MPTARSLLVLGRGLDDHVFPFAGSTSSPLPIAIHARAQATTRTRVIIPFYTGPYSLDSVSSVIPKGRGRAVLLQESKPLSCQSNFPGCVAGVWKFKWESLDSSGNFVCHVCTTRLESHLTAVTSGQGITQTMACRRNYGHREIIVAIYWYIPVTCHTSDIYLYWRMSSRGSAQGAAKCKETLRRKL